MFQKIDQDPKWYPGKEYRETKPGPKPVLTAQKAQGIKRAMEAAKEDDLEPTYSLALARAPNATRNPETGEPFSKKAIYNVFKSWCHDPGQDEAWVHDTRLQKTALPADVCEKRLACARHLDGLHTAGWYHRHVTWYDFCSSLLPRTVAKAKEQALARKGKKGWGSPGARLYAKNLRGKETALKLNSTDSMKVWWMPVLVRGKLHVEMLPEDFPGECPEGAAIAVGRIPSVLNTRFREEMKPRIVMTDRGKGFYKTVTGEITPAYDEALKQHDLRPLMGSNAKIQPGNLQELMLHETAVAWIRWKLERSLPASPWEETRAEFESRIKDAVRAINDTYDVASLTHELPDRITELIDNDGGRIPK